MTSSAFELTAIRCDAFEVDTDGAQHTGHRTVDCHDLVDFVHRVVHVSFTVVVPR